MNDVEKHVVQLDLDNSGFEKGAKQSIKTTAKLEDALVMKGAVDGLEQVTAKISKLDAVMISVISNITNRVINLGVNLVKSLSVDNISNGWQKFGDKTTSVATMMAQTIKIAGKEITNYEEKMEAINEQLERLNWFTDETSYSFTDMVNNIGKFTAAGVDLDVSVKAMMGIANWAALSGQNAATASRAMYQLAQSIGMGTVQLMDWKSIENANMATVEFKQTVIDTAVAMGELTKQGDKYITKTGKKFDVASFRESLSAKWFTSDVLTKSLEKYSAAVERIYEISEETGLTASQVMARYGDELDEFGIKAFAAAQEAKTFADTIGSVKDAVSTGWMNTAEKIFGAYTESKELWTDLANELYDVFAEGGNFRNDILSLWSSLEGRKDLFEHGGDNQGAFWNIYDAIIAVVDTFKSTWRTVFPKTLFEGYDDQVSDLANKFKGFTAGLKEATARFKDMIENGTKLRGILTGVFSVVKIGINVLKGIWYAIDPLVTTVKFLISDLLDFVSGFGKSLNRTANSTNKIFSIASKVNEILTKIIDTINPRGILSKAIDFIFEIRDAFVLLFQGISKGFSDVAKDNSIGGLTDSLSVLFTSIQNLVIKFVNFFNKYVAPYLKGFIENIGVFIGRIAGYVTHIVTFFSKIIDIFSELFSGSLKGSDVINVFRGALSGLVNIISGLVKALASLFKLNKKGGGDSITETISEASGIKKGDEKEVSIMSQIMDIIGGVLKSLAPVISAMLRLVKAILSLLEPLIGLIVKVIDIIAAMLVNISKKGLSSIIMTAIAVVVITKIVSAFTKIGSLIQFFVDAIGGVADLLDATAVYLRVKAIIDFLMSLASSLMVLSVAFLLLKRVDARTLGIGIALMASLMGMVLLLNEIVLRSSERIAATKGLGASTFANVMRSLTKALSSIAKTMFVLSASFAILGKINWESSKSAIVNMESFMIGLMGLFAILTHTNFDIKKVNAINKLIKGLQQFALGMILMSVAFAAVGVMLSALKHIDWSTFGMGMLLITSLTVMMGLLGVLSKYISSLNFILFTTSMVLFGVALSAVAAAFAILQTINQETIGKGFGLLWGLVGLMTVVKIFSTLLGGLKLILFATAMTIFGVALTTMATALAIMNSLNDAAVKKGVNAFKDLTGLLHNARWFMTTKGAKKLAIFAGALVIFGVAMNEFASALAIMSSLNAGGMAAANGAIVALLAMVTVFAKFSGIMGSLSIALLSTGLVVFAAALTSLAVAFAMFSALSWMEIGKGFVVIAGSMVLLAGAAMLLDQFKFGLLAASTSMLIFGAGLMLVATSISLLATSLVLLADVTATSLSAILEAIAAMITTVLEFIVNNSVLIAEALLTLINIGISLLHDSLPLFIEALVLIGNALLGAIQELAPTIWNTVGELIQGVLEFVRDHVTRWAGTLFEICTALLDELEPRLPQLIHSLVTFLTTLIVSTLESLSDNMNRYVNAGISFILDFISELGRTFKNRAGEFVDIFAQFGADLMAGLGNGIKQGASNLWDTVCDAGSAVVDWFAGLFGIHSPSRVMKEMGVYLDEGLAIGIEEGANETKDSIYDSMSEIISTISDAIEDEVDDDLTITPVLDLSNVQAGASDISSLMRSVSGGSVSVSGNLASTASREINRNKQSASTNQNGSVTTNNTTDNYYATFNITTNDPEELARETDKILQRNRFRSNLAKGGV